MKEDTIFVAGMPPSADACVIAQFFGQIGIIKVSVNFEKLIYFGSFCTTNVRPKLPFKLKSKLCNVRIM